MQHCPRTRRLVRRTRVVALLAFAPAVMGAGGDAQGGQGCAVFSESDAPDLGGTWDLEYDDTLRVELEIGGAVYVEEIGLAGGTIEIDHNGTPLTFDLDCARPEVVCPSEVWPETFEAEHRSEKFPHQVIVLLPQQHCDGELVAPSAAACGQGTANPDCEEVCMGELVTEPAEVFGVIDEPGERLEVLLGGGVASNGINCALLGLSVATADIDAAAPTRNGDWLAHGLSNGEVVTGYSGGCLWAGDPNMDGELEALVVGAQLRFTTGFSATRR